MNADIFRPGAMSTTANTTQQKTLTLADIERVAQVLRDMPAEPIGEWMRQQGRPPELWRVVFPEAMRQSDDAPTVWPEYVAFSAALDKPVFLACGVSSWVFGPNAGVQR